jgi:hypothetical protein
MRICSAAQSQAREANRFGRENPAQSPNEPISCASVLWQPRGVVTVTPFSRHDVCPGGRPWRAGPG